VDTQSIRESGEHGEKRLVKVPSASRPGRIHFVDVEAGRCSCEGYAFTRDCRHLRALRPVGCFECGGLGTKVSYPKLATCLRCDGTGMVGGAV
jgi:DnaJ-class molecular chaperone